MNRIPLVSESDAGIQLFIELANGGATILALFCLFGALYTVVQYLYFKKYNKKILLSSILFLLLAIASWIGVALYLLFS